ncbi:hypothetical protein [uncultured Demequina sp.]|uniref:hypothetical protein n=1 Tax=uncultured Demequina sp. TaxID=693499 RepID=UPI0025FF0712|nr:hypothetical protein [uncultured Demequina sp.]
MKTAAAAFAATLALAGCTSAIGDLDHEDSPVARYNWTGDEGMEALLEGELLLTDGCLYIVSDDAEPTVAAMPREFASWRSEDDVLTFDGLEFSSGDAVAAAGGFVEPSGDIDRLDIPEACDLGEWGEIFLVHDTDLTPAAG